MMMSKKSKLKIFSRIINDDAFVALNGVKNKSVDLVITSPPYNIGKEYEKGVRMDIAEYVEWQTKIIKKIDRKLSPTASVCWQVGNYVKNAEVLPLDYLFFDIFHALGFKLRNRIIWQFDFGLHAQKRFSGRYETILWFTKNDNYKFNLDPIRVPQKYPGKRHAKTKFNKAGAPSGNRLGKNPSDYWEFSPKEFLTEQSVWKFQNVKANHPEKTIHPCQFPIELAERCLLALTDPGDVILDPFAGSGTSVIAALKHGRSSIGIDQDSKYASIARARVRDFKNGELKLRDIGKPIASPEKSGRVARIPEEWLNDAA